MQVSSTNRHSARAVPAFNPLPGKYPPPRGNAKAKSSPQKHRRVRLQAIEEPVREGEARPMSSAGVCDQPWGAAAGAAHGDL